MAVPCIKGTALVSAHEDVNRLVAEGRLSRERLEAELSADALALLDAKIAAGSWYPIRAYEQLVELLVRQEAGGRREAYLIERGARAAERLAAAGIYQQLELSLERVGASVGKLATSLSGAIYNFGRWRYVSDRSSHFEVTVEDAADFSESARLTAHGFIRCMAERIAGAPARLESRRPTCDRVVFRAELDLPEAPEPPPPGAQGRRGSA